MKSVYFDISDILRYSKSNRTLTGIQRFVTQAIAHLVKKHGSDVVKLIAYHPRKKRFVCYDASYFLGWCGFDRIRFRHHFGLREWPWIPLELASYVDNRYGAQRNDLISIWLLLKSFIKGGREFRKRNIVMERPKKSAEPVDADMRLAPGDLVFIGGSAWDELPVHNELLRLKRVCGVRLCHFVHDLIPIVAPQLAGTSPKKFENWLKTISSECDYLLVNSVASARDLKKWLVDNGFSVDVGVVKLAHQFADMPRDYMAFDGVRRSVRIDARVPYALCVGTLNARKNIWTLANVWREVHSRLGVSTPRLIFAGKPGAGSEDFHDFMRASGSLYGYIRIIESPSDDELAYLYRNCLFSVFPSYFEGWGLPIGECLWFGRPVVCSSTSSMPEVGGDLVDYIDPMNPESIVKAVLKMITDVEYRERRAVQISEARLRSWADVADDLWHELSNRPATRASSAQ